MKKYKKKPDSLFQVRMATKEYKALKETINKFGVTHRDFLLAVVNEVKDKETRDKRLAERIKLNSGYSKAGH